MLSTHHRWRRRYGWRDVTAAIGVCALLLQIGLGVVAGLTADIRLDARATAGESLAALTQEICSPDGLLRLGDAGPEDGSDARGGPVCPGCLIAKLAPVPPAVTFLAASRPDRGHPAPPAARDDIPASIELISGLRPRAPPVALG